MCKVVRLDGRPLRQPADPRVHGTGDCVASVGPSSACAGTNVECRCSIASASPSTTVVCTSSLLIHHVCECHSAMMHTLDTMTDTISCFLSLHSPDSDSTAAQHAASHSGVNSKHATPKQRHQPTAQTKRRTTWSVFTTAKRCVEMLSAIPKDNGSSSLTADSDSDAHFTSLPSARSNGKTPSTLHRSRT